MVEVKLVLSIPEGFEATGEYRTARSGDWYLASGVAYQHEGFGSGAEFPILRKINKHIEIPCAKCGKLVLTIDLSAIKHGVCP